MISDRPFDRDEYDAWTMDTSGLADAVRVIGTAEAAEAAQGLIDAHATVYATFVAMEDEGPFDQRMRVAHQAFMDQRLAARRELISAMRADVAPNL